MLRWLRRPSASRLLLLVSVAAIGAQLNIVHVPDADDAACEVGLFAHDASAHRFSRSTGPNNTQPQHCDTCHWLRMMRAAATARSPIASSEPRVGRIVALIAPAFTQQLDERIRPRSPPA